MTDRTIPYAIRKLPPGAERDAAEAAHRKAHKGPPASCRCGQYECDYCRRKRFAKEQKQRDAAYDRRHMGKAGA